MNGIPTLPLQQRQRTRLRRLAAQVVLAALGSVQAVACAPAGSPAPPPASPADWLASVRVVDLTHPLSPDSLYWPTGSPFEFERISWGADEAGNWYAAARFCTPEHLGTHLDAPVHFSESGWTNDAIPAERFVAPAVVIDISERAAEDPDATLAPEDIAGWGARHGPIPAGAIVLVRSGWSSRWPDWNAYYGSDTPFDTATLHFPGVSPEAAELLVQRGVGGVGIDTASIDPGNDVEFRAHRVLSAGNLFNLENLTGLDALPEEGALLLALPVKIAGGSGGPTRVLALVPEQEGTEG